METIVLENKKTGEKFAKRIMLFLPSLLFGFIFLTTRTAKEFGLDSTVSNLIVLTSGTVATLWIAHQRLPFQNIVGLVVTIAIFSGGIFLGGNILKIPFASPIQNTTLNSLPAWTSPLLWTIALVNARGVAKLVLHKIRRMNNFGLWLIGFSSVLVAALCRIEPFVWQTFLLQFMLALVAFVATTPWFIDKKPKDQPPDFQPLFITILILLW